MKDITVDALQGKDVLSITTVEKQYDQFEVHATTNVGTYRLCKAEGTRGYSEKRITRLWTPYEAQAILDIYTDGETLNYSWIHDPQLWEE